LQEHIMLIEQRQRKSTVGIEAEHNN